MTGQSPVERLLIVGADHLSAPAALRDALLLAAEDPVARLAEIKDSGVPEACLLATCDRVLVVALDNQPEAAAQRLLDLQARWAEVALEAYAPHAVRHFGPDALRHLFAVAASLESQVLGEPQVLGQVKDSHRLAAAHGVLGPGLERLMQAAYGVAKRARSETGIAEGPVSMASTGLGLARRLHGDLSRCRALLIGLGEMSEVFAEALRAVGVADLTFLHPSRARAETAAHRWRAHVRPWEELLESLAASEIVISAVGQGSFAIDAATAKEALRRRRQRPIFLIDAAVPRDVDPAVARLDSAFVYDLADLESATDLGRQGREDAAQVAWSIVESELASHLADSAERRAVPSVTALREHFESMRREVLANGKLDAEAATRLLMNRLLHDPSEALRRSAAEAPSEQKALERSLCRLFRIESPLARDGEEDES